MIEILYDYCTLHSSRCERRKEKGGMDGILLHCIIINFFGIPYYHDDVPQQCFFFFFFPSSSFYLYYYYYCTIINFIICCISINYTTLADDRRNYRFTVSLSGTNTRFPIFIPSDLTTRLWYTLQCIAD